MSAKEELHTPKVEELDGDRPTKEESNSSTLKRKAVSSVCNRGVFQGKVKTIDDLPLEMLVEIFRHLDVDDLIFGVKHVSEHWAEVSQDTRVWKKVSYSPVGNTPLRRVVSILKQSPKLEVFHACSQPGTAVAILEALGDSCKVVKKVSVSVDALNSRSLARLLKEKLSHSIEELFLKFNGYSEVESLNSYDFDEKDLFNAIGCCVNLRSLVLHGFISDIAYNTMEGIALGCPKLQELNTVFLSGFEQKDFNFVLQRKGYQLLSLTIDWNSLRSQDTLPIVSECCKKLEKLSVGNYGSKRQNVPDMFKDTKIVPKDFKALKQIFGLQELTLPYLGVSYVKNFLDLFENGNLCTLIALDLSFVDSLNAVLVQSICQNCRALERLNIEGCLKVGNESFMTLDNLTKLIYLNIAKCREVEDRGVDYIVKCKTLKYLNLKSCPKLSIKSLKMCIKNLKLHEIYFNSCKLYESDVLGFPKHLLKFLEVEEVEVVQVKVPGSTDK